MFWGQFDTETLDHIRRELERRESAGEASEHVGENLAEIEAVLALREVAAMRGGEL